ncbi:kinesin K39 [Strigomonas culicis]|uniref:Kinesin K39 n=1 Tax=Strigomonas culicis TaxID=28005 RepID=S9TPX6_9TRYP|nr:kinesin K39 [Strigomonas culicis]|eukprot:EPY18694.1 kinesin K39 [Strigomonas culicis]
MSSDYSYSYSYSEEVDVDEYGPMWDQIARMPFDHLQETDNFTYINKVISLIAKYNFSVGDYHMSDKQFTIHLAKLLKLISSKCASRISELEKECSKTGKDKEEEMRVLKKKLDAQNEEILRLREDLESQVSRRETLKAQGAPTLFADSNQEIKNLKEENNKLTMELNRMRRTVDELRQQQQTRLEDCARVNLDTEKTQLEYKHLVARHKRLLEKSAKTEELLEEMRKSDRQKRHREDTDLDKLRQKVQSLQEENLKLVESRDRAEELCERRESETLRDMQELKRLSQELISEEKEKLKAVSDALNKEIEDRYAQIAELEEELREKSDENDSLREQMQKLSSIPKRHFDDDKSGSSSSSATPRDTEELDAPLAISGKGAAELKRLERENDDLAAEVEQLEMRNDAFEEENMRLNRLLRDLEGGDEGLLRLRHQIEDSTRTVEILQSENSQLRERLNGMQDSLTFTAALQELCKRVGVTEEEINSLRPQNAVAFSEMDTLREELSILKEEVEWLERERRYWMNKVRLQPLMDTKLRFELGLSSEQLRQLDELVDQMKEGRIVVEDTDTDYKEKYFQELQKRRKDAEQFSEYVKSRIDDAIERTFGEATAGDAAAALSALKEHIDLIAGGRLGTVFGGVAAPGEVKSMTHRLDQSALTIKDNSEVIMDLREKLSAAIAERDAVCKERDQYRGAIFQAAGVDDEDDNAKRLDSDTNPAEDGAGSGGGGGIHLSNAKWMTVSKTLRDQLDAKDNLIASLGEKMKDLQEKIQGLQQNVSTHSESVETLTRENETLKNQVSAVSEMNEELAGENNQLKKVNKEVTESIERLNQGSSRDVLQKIVLLRRREATLMQRLRRALVSQEEAAKAEQTMRRTMQLTFQSMQEAFEGTSTGFVLPPSSATHNTEEEMLSFLQSSANGVLMGRLCREDSRHLLHLQQVYHHMDQFEEITALRVTAKQRQKEKEELARQLDEQRVEIETLKVAAHTGSSGGGESSAAKWESEATSWRQKYTLCQKRFEDKVAEVDLLEKELDASRGELVDMKNYVSTLLQEEEAAQPHNVPKTAAPLQTAEGAGTAATATTAKEGAGVPRRTTPDGVAHASRMEREVARLKSINLGLLHHSMDLQATVKSLEVDLEGKRQEILLIKDSGNANLVSDFVSAAIREHTALRRQSELALIQTKRAKMQLAATEANYHIVSNEATAYKLSAYRLYRKYVDQMVSVVDYLRYMQRSSKGALTPHRAEVMDRRYRQLLTELQSAQSHNTSLAMQFSDQKNAITTLEQQIALSKIGGNTERDDMVEKRLREARASVRESARLLVEGKEECKYAEAKSHRLEAFIKQLEEEMTRLEWCSWSLSPLDDAALNNLLALKETVFSKAEAPPVAIQAVYDMPTFRGVGGNDDADVAVREYKAVALKQAEYARECTNLRKALTDAEVENKKSAATIAEPRDELVRLDERVTFYQSQLDTERTKAEARETRLVKAHETQADVARRATEHNSSCLRDMLQKKELTIQQLQEQLRVERQKYAEHQLEESSRNGTAARAHVQRKRGHGGAL